MTIELHRHGQLIGTAAEWTTANPVVGLGELGIESDTDLVKYGNGVAAWSALSYMNPGPAGPTGPPGPGGATESDILEFAAANTGGGKEKVAALSATSGTATGNLSNASVFTVTPTGNITLAFSNIPTTGTACTLTVIISMGSLKTVTMPAGTVWLSGAPDLVASKTAVFTMLTVDGGTTWIASAGVEA